MTHRFVASFAFLASASVLLASCGSSVPDFGGLGPGAPPAAQYDVTALSSQLGDSASFAGLNDAGVIVGVAWSGGVSRNVLIKRGGVVVDLGACEPAGVNDAGIVACRDGSIWTSTGQTTLVAATSRAEPITLGINDAGQIAGELVNINGPAPACGSDCTFIYWGPGDTAIVDGRIGPDGFALASPAVPRLNIATGVVTVSGRSHFPPTLMLQRPGEEPQPLGCAGADDFAEFFAVGGKNEVVGESAGSAIVCRNGSMTVLATGRANDISRKGQVVGTSGGQGFLYDGTTFSFLDDRLLTSGWEILSADLVNDNGQIIATAKNTVSGRQSRVLLTEHQ
jgi:hypothetical protein